ncbi:MAG: PelD GGDEF domain-containing protein [Succinivibrio sp.]
MTKVQLKSELIKFFTRGSKQIWISFSEVIVLSLISAILWTSSMGTEEQITYEGVIYTVSNSQSFFWPLVFVLLVALRYGFSYGFISALLCILITIVYAKSWDLMNEFSFYKAVGLLIVVMIAGEFRDAWEERLHRNDLDYSFMKKKLDLFTQNYFTLRASHDQLEQRMAGQTVSLRSTISELEKISDELAQVNRTQEERLKKMASPVLYLLAQIVGIEEAGFYIIDEKGRINPEALEKIGNMQELDVSDPMVLDMLKTEHLLSPVDFYDAEHSSKYQLCIPLKNTDEKLIGCVIVSEVKFFTLTEQNISILNLVVNYAADMLSNDVIAPVIDHSQKHTFMRYLKYVFTETILRHEQSSVIFCKGHTKEALQLFDKTLASRRGADIYWTRKDGNGNSVLVVLLPLTSIVQAQMFLDRIKEQAKHNELDDKDLEFIGPLDAYEGNELLVTELKKLGLTDADLDKCTKFY